MSEEVKKVSNKTKVFWICTVLVIAGLLLYLGGNSARNDELSQREKSVVEYLDLKYKRDFAVKSERYISANNSYEFFIYPKDDPEFTFQVWTGMAGQSITETYLLMNEKRDMEKWVKPYLDAITKEHYIDAIGANTPSDYEGYDDPILRDMHANKLTLQQILDKYPGKLQAFVWCYFGIDITPENKEEILKKVYALYKFLKDKKFGRVDLVLKIVEPKYFFNNSLLECQKALSVSEFNLLLLQKNKMFIIEKNTEIKSYQDFCFRTYKTLNKGE